MASIWKRPESKFYTACWTDAKGRRLKRSTKETDKKKAEKRAQLFEEESRRKRSAKQARKILADIYKEISGEDMPTATVRKYLTGFVVAKKPEVSAATYDYYAGHSKRFLAWMGPKADSDIAEVSKRDITDYRNHVATTVGPRTTNNTLKAVKAFFAAAQRDGYLVDDPAEDVVTVRDRSESARRPFTLDELRAVLAVADTEWRSMILFGLYTGQRLSDIATLTWANIDTARDEIRMVTRKMGRRQTLPLAPPLRVHLTTLAASDDPKAPLHPAAAKRHKASGRAGKLSDQFADILTAAGLRDGTLEPEEGNARAKYELSFHSLRHTATSLLKAAGIPQSVVMDYIGHDSDAVSRGYTHVGREALEKAAAAFPAL